LRRGALLRRVIDRCCERLGMDGDEEPLQTRETDSRGEGHDSRSER
jgi:hypothetical protein